MANDINNPVIEGINGQRFIRTEQGLTPLEEAVRTPGIAPEQPGPESLLGVQPEQAPALDGSQSLGDLEDRFQQPQVGLNPPQQPATPLEMIEQADPQQITQSLVEAPPEAFRQTIHKATPESVDAIVRKVDKTGLEAIKARVQAQIDAPIPSNEGTTLGNMFKALGAGLTGDQDALEAAIKADNPNFVTSAERKVALRDRAQAKKLKNEIIKGEIKQLNALEKLQKEQDFTVSQDTKKATLRVEERQADKNFEREQNRLDRKAQFDQKKFDAEAKAAAARLKDGTGTKAQREADIKLNKDLTDWRLKDQGNTLSRLDDADLALKEMREAQDAGDEFSSAVIGAALAAVPERFRDAVRSQTNPRLAKVKAIANALTIKNLRATLGPQFTQREGTEFKGLDFDESVGLKENIRRIQAKRDLIQRYLTRMNGLNRVFTEGAGTLRGLNLQKLDEETRQLEGTPAPAKSQKNPTQSKRDRIKARREAIQAELDRGGK